jgi:hypothetical protein
VLLQSKIRNGSMRRLNARFSAPIFKIGSTG